MANAPEVQQALRDKYQQQQQQQQPNNNNNNNNNNKSFMSKNNNNNPNDEFQRARTPYSSGFLFTVQQQQQ